MRLLAAALMAFLIAPGLANADKGNQGKGKDKGHKSKGKADKAVVVRDADGDRRVVFVDDDRRVVRGWWTDTYGRGNCPPGLAKKNNGCLPPGQARKRYAVGQRLPRTVVVERVPGVLLPRLRAVPAGYEYVVVDGDVLLMESATRLVADAIVNLID